MADRCNVLLITSDSQRTDTLGCMGSGCAHSPNLDALAERGVLFTQAHSAAPVCMPARCSIMTGLHTPLHGCLENGLERQGDAVFFTDTLKAAGYTTAMVGKTHFGPLPDSFDICYAAEGEKGAAADDCFGREMTRRGFPRASAHPNPVPEKDCLESLIVDRAIESIAEMNKSRQPFFMFCSLLSPHSPIDPPGRFLTGDILAGAVPPPRFRSGEWETLPETIKKFCGIPNPRKTGLDEARGSIADDLAMEDMLEYRERYYRSAAYVDSLVGRLVDFLDSSGLSKNTLVIFTSDHGIQNFDHGFNDKHNYYDESFRVPFIMSLPGLLPENERRGFASHVDIAPTILSAAGCPCDYANGFDLFGPLTAGGENPRHFAAAALYGSLALVTEDWKIEYYPRENRLRLFDRKHENGEDNDLGGDPAHAGTAARMSRALLAWRAGMLDATAMKRRVKNGGPVARRVTDDVLAENGSSAELRIEKLFFWRKEND
jgi:arylsulfatase A-like enzyme